MSPSSTCSTPLTFFPTLDAYRAGVHQHDDNTNNNTSNNSRVMAASPVKNELSQRLKLSPNSPFIKLIAGMAGGVTEAVCLQPLDVTKTRLQLPGSKYKGMFDCLQTIVKEEGAASLYKGLTPFVTHLTLKYALRFGMFEQFKQMLGASKTGETTAGKNFTAGLMVGSLEACLIVTPFEVVKTRLQKQKGTTNLKYKGPIDVVVKVVRDEGLRRMWSGNMPTVIRQGSNQAFNFMSMAILNRVLWDKRQGDGKQLAVWKTLLSGLLAGAVGPMFNCPVDVIKTRMMAQEYGVGQTQKYTGWFQAGKLIAKEEGTAALWKGLIPRLTRLAPGQAITWTVVMRVSSYFEQAHISDQEAEKHNKTA